MNLIRTAQLGACICLSSPCLAESDTATSVNEPAGEFNSLLENSPFTRSLNLPNSIHLTGVAKVDGRLVATLVDVTTKESYTVSDTPNPQGWTLVEIDHEYDIDKITAKVSVNGGEIVSVRYDKDLFGPNGSFFARKSSGKHGHRSGHSNQGHWHSRDRQKLFEHIDRNQLPKGYDPRRHQEYVDRRLSGLSNEQKSMIGRMWGEKQRGDPRMANRGQSFVRIMEYVATRGRR